MTNGTVKSSYLRTSSVYLEYMYVMDFTRLAIQRSEFFCLCNLIVVDCLMSIKLWFNNYLIMQLFLSLTFVERISELGKNFFISPTGAIT